jgi:hypothetical protein
MEQKQGHQQGKDGTCREPGKYPQVVNFDSAQQDLLSGCNIARRRILIRGATIFRR